MSKSRLVCFVEGNIGSGKSTVANVLQTTDMTCISEQQHTEEWTLLSGYYDSGMKNNSLNYELQKQIANSYFKHYFKYNFCNPCETMKPSNMFNMSLLHEVMTIHNNVLKFHPVTKSMMDFSSKENTDIGNPSECKIFFEGLLSSSGVFTPMEYDKGLIDERDYLDLCQNYDAINKGVHGHVVFYLKPNNIDTCINRIKARNRTFESTISESYIKTIDEHYESLMNRVSRTIPVFVIDNSLLSPSDTAKIMLEITETINNIHKV